MKKGTSMKRASKLYFWRMVLLIGVAVFVLLYLFLLKKIFHIDELFSYGLANGANGVYLYHTPDEIDNKLLSGDFFHKYLIQTEDSSFSKMWQNLAGDNHMPFYFVLLRTACSLFGAAEFSIIPGIMVNVLVLIFSIIGFYKLSFLVFKDRETAYGLCILFSFLKPVISLEIYIRMYLLLLGVSIWFILAMVRFLVCREQEKKSFRTLWGILFFGVLLILTHYYSFIFCVVSLGAACVVLGYEKRYKDIFCLSGVILLSVGISYLIYPAMIKVGLYGERGAQSFSLIERFLSSPLEVLEKQLPLFIDTIFGGVTGFALSVMLWCGLFFLSLKKKLTPDNDKILAGFLFLLFIGYGGFSSLIMPVMQSYQIRYFAPIIPVGVLLVGYAVIWFLRLMKQGARVIYLVLYVLGGLNGAVVALNKDNPFYLRGTRFSYRLEKIIKGADIWWGMGGGWTHAWVVHNFIDKLALADKVWMLADYDNKEFPYFAKNEAKKGIYAYLLLPKQQEIQPEGAVEWVKQTTGRRAYYLFTVKSHKVAAMAFEAAVFLVCP